MTTKAKKSVRSSPKWLKRPSHTHYTSPPNRTKVDTTSEVIPDQSISVREFMERHTRGLYDPSEIKDGIFHDNPDHDVEEPMYKSKLEALEDAEEAKGVIDIVNKHGKKKETLPGTKVATNNNDDLNDDDK